MKIALDVDGILADFYLGMCRRYNKPYEFLKDWQTDWITEVFHEVDGDEEFWKTLPMITPPEGITFNFECYMTSLPPAMADARSYWLGYNGYPNKPVIVTNDKFNVCQEMGIEMLIDDKPETISSLIMSPTIPVLFVPSYLPEAHLNCHTVKSLGQVNQIINNYGKFEINY